MMVKAAYVLGTLLVLVGLVWIGQGGRLVSDGRMRDR
jgi:hypothetical protein